MSYTSRSAERWIDRLRPRQRGGVLLATAVLSAGLVASGCRDAAEPAAQERTAPLTLAPEDVSVVTTATLERGPVISGPLSPEVQATVRAEAGGSVLSVRADAGQAVRKGEVLATIDAASLRDQALSARTAVRSARTSRDLARREMERLATLVQAGAVAEQELENARRALTTAEAQLADAEARLAAAQEQVGNTTARSPIAGVVSNRPVNAGDVVQPGTELFTIVDPASMQLEGAIPADQLGDVRRDDAVRFEVTGYPDLTFSGTVSRINPTVDPATGQVQLTVSIPNDGQRLVGGLFARGRVVVEQQHGLVVPAAAVTRTPGATRVTVIRNDTVQHVDIEIGLEDSLNERLLVRSGLHEGDMVLLGAAKSLSDGTQVAVPQRRSPDDQGGAEPASGQ